MESSNKTQRLVECVGLWLAEGDHKSIREITFTNNCETLLRHFHKTLREMFPKGRFRLYVYSPNGQSDFKLKNCVMRSYTDARANKPYYIFRYADTKSVVKWKTVVSEICKRKRYFSGILRGFFAGEGNIKTGLHYNRTIRIAQKQPIEIIDLILRELGITYRFSVGERAYVIHGWKNWEKFFRYEIFTLHPDKRKRFLEAWKSYKEIHYPVNFIRNNILSELSKPLTCRQLAVIFKRKPATLQDVLCRMKVDGTVRNYRSGSLDYWAKSNSNMVVISDRKAKILDLLENPRKVHEIAEKMGVGWKAARKRLAELEKLGLARRENYLWHKIPTTKQVIVL